MSCLARLRYRTLRVVERARKNLIQEAPQIGIWGAFAPLSSAASNKPAGPAGTVGSAAMSSHDGLMALLAAYWPSEKHREIGHRARNFVDISSETRASRPGCRLREPSTIISAARVRAGELSRSASLAATSQHLPRAFIITPRQRFRITHGERDLGDEAQQFDGFAPRCCEPLRSAPAAREGAALVVLAERLGGVPFRYLPRSSVEVAEVEDVHRPHLHADRPRSVAGRGAGLMQQARSLQ